ncbi:MAG TPA: (2Fe-2S)-binding protein [Dehalococcoidia bacterium]|nr:(2Fe-2S)-binding protein [Dehalococcoidia bacterium]HLB29186.1 (2Fe-2S)-binding protein [Dehalococcoidia bacterium]
MSSRTTIRLRVNGQPYELAIPTGRLLVDLLRYDLGLTGTKESCGVGVCGACTILLNGRMVSSCLTPALFADGAEVVTIEGLAPDGRLHPIQEAFLKYGGFQCGFCTPGMVLAAKALLDEDPDPSQDDIKEWLKGNLCRCTGYYKILESVQRAAQTGRAIPLRGSPGPGGLG